MRFLITLLLAALSVPALARPLALVLPGHGEIPDAVAACLSPTVDLLIYSPDLPAIKRAVQNGSIVKNETDPTRLARAVGAGYAVLAAGEVGGGVAKIAVSAKKVGGGEWSSSAESPIAEEMGPTADVKRRAAIYTAASAAVSSIVIEAFGPDAALAARPSEVETTAVFPGYDETLALAESYRAREDTANAMLELHRAVDIDPTRPEARVALAQLYLDLGMSREAEDECRRGLLWADDPKLNATLGRIRMLGGDLAGAESAFLALLARDPEDVETWNFLGNLYWNMGRLNDAAAAFKKAGATDRLYQLYTASGKYREAFAARLGSGGYLDAAKIVLDELPRADAEKAQALYDFLNGLIVPAQYKAAHDHAILAASLLMQDSEVFGQEASNELELYRKAL
ncbi:MAG: tetratricopeptide repeat protein [Armatimonadota bacterium]